MTCRDCDCDEAVYISPLDACPLCAECAQREVSGLLEGLDREELGKIRRRVEDCLRKSPIILMRVAANLAAGGYS